MFRFRFFVSNNSFCVKNPVKKVTKLSWKERNRIMCHIQAFSSSFLLLIIKILTLNFCKSTSSIISRAFSKSSLTRLSVISPSLSSRARLFTCRSKTRNINLQIQTITTFFAILCNIFCYFFCFDSIFFAILFALKYYYTII